MKAKQDLTASVAYAACILVEHLGAKAVVTTTHSGFTAKQVSRFKPKTKLIAFSPDRATVLRLALYWGCIPILVDLMDAAHNLCRRQHGQGAVLVR